MVGLVTLVTILVGSVTSTCLRSSLGDMRTYSAPILPVSSGALPGQSRTTTPRSPTPVWERAVASGLSAASTGEATHNQVTRERADAMRFMWKPLRSLETTSRTVGSLTDSQDGRLATVSATSFQTAEQLGHLLGG